MDFIVLFDELISICSSKKQRREFILWLEDLHTGVPKSIRQQQISYWKTSLNKLIAKFHLSVGGDDEM